MPSGAALFALAALLCAVPQPGPRGAAAASAAWTAWLNVSWENGADRNQSGWEAGESGLYGLDSPLQSAEGLLVLPDSPDAFNACSVLTNFSGAPPAGGSPGWLALIQRGGGCSFAHKIRLAAERGAAAAVIYNYRGTGNEVLPMSHHGERRGTGGSQREGSLRWERPLPFPPFRLRVRERGTARPQPPPHIGLLGNSRECRDLSRTTGVSARTGRCCFGR